MCISIYSSCFYRILTLDSMLQNNFIYFRLKHTKSESATYITNTSFSDVPKNSQPITQKVSQKDSKQAKLRFRKSAFVTTAVQSKKTNKTNNIAASDDSESDDSVETTKKVKKKNTTTKSKSKKSNVETKNKNL